MDVALLLGAIPKDAKPFRIGLQAPDEIVAYAVGLTRADHVRKAKGASNEFKHVAVSCDKTFTGKLARPIGRDWDTGTVVLGKRDPGIFAIHSAAGGVENL